MVALLMIAVACSDDGSSEGSTDDSGDNTGEASDGEGLSGTLEIQYFVGGYGDSWWKEVIGDFQEEHPDLEIKEHAGPNINEEMRSRWVSGDPPDVVYIDGAGSSETQMVEDGQLMDLTDWVQDIEVDGTPLMDSFIVPPSDFDGSVYSLPLVFDSWGTWYDKAWFEENNWEVPSDFESFMSSMGQIQEDTGISPFVTTGQHPYYFLRGMLYPAFGAAGGDELLNDVITGAEGAWSSDTVLEVMKKVEEMQKAGYIDEGFAAINHTQSQMNFLLHDNAYIPVGFWLPNEMEGDKPENLEYGFIPSPMNDAGEPMAVVPDLRPLAIAEEAENPEAAKAFVEFVFTKQYAKSFSEHTGAIMNLQGVDLSSNENVPQYLIDANEMINDPEQAQIYHKPHPMSADLETPISDSLVSLMLGNITAEEFVEEAEQAAAEYRESQ
ncbi:ABC transporter substrate-binding protein [Lentibacillus amyloliquefaciens]|uniref:Sugar ABC transporter substrate-binding protein n=1 Tax=Lentibacillus amyloliquefaciens TaxID=1472767 RepID=A0A0U4FPV8_9BACI|nr:sugar ABC transporter substrate-binding protein [Lentibacillus amyloliquefaciens]